MAFTGNFMCSSFKKELLEGVHDFSSGGSDVFKLALYTDSASFTAATTGYTSTNEIIDGSGSYTAGGETLTKSGTTLSGTTAFTTFSNVTITPATITARGALIYNDTPAGDPTVAVLDFTENKTSTGGDFTIQFPSPASASNAVIRIE